MFPLEENLTDEIFLFRGGLPEQEEIEELGTMVDLTLRLKHLLPVYNNDGKVELTNEQFVEQCEFLEQAFDMAIQFLAYSLLLEKELKIGHIYDFGEIYGY